MKGPDIDLGELEKKISSPDIKLILINLPGRLTESCTEETLCLLSAMFEKAGVKERAIIKKGPTTLKIALVKQETPCSRKEIVTNWDIFERELSLIRHSEKKIALYVPRMAEISARTQTMADLTINIHSSGEMQLIT